MTSTPKCFDGLEPNDGERAQRICDQLPPEERDDFLKLLGDLAQGLADANTRMEGSVTVMEGLTHGMQQKVRTMQDQEEKRARALDSQQADNLLSA